MMEMELRLTDQDGIPTVKRYGTDLTSTSVMFVLYLVTVLKIAPSYMKHRPAFDLRSYIVVYNIFQIFICTYLMYVIYIIKLPVFQFWKCIDFIPGSSEDRDFHHIAYVVFWLKVSEFTETMVFILRKKHRQVSFLHIFHHCCTFFLAYHFNNSYKSSAGLFPLFVNLLVHLIMYTYYLMAAVLSPEFIAKLTPFKKSLTIIQMVQFTIVLVQVVSVMYAGCKLPTGLLVLYITIVIVIFYMFYDFYQKSYIQKQNAVLEKAKREQDELNNNIIKTN